MRRTFMGFFACILSISNIYAQPPRNETNQVRIYREGFFLESSVGFSSAALTRPVDILNSNPAYGDKSSKGVAIGVTFHTQERTYLPPGINIANINHQYPFLPNSFSLISARGKWQFGAGFYQKYSHNVDIGEVSITTSGDPGGVSDSTFRPEFRTAIYRAAIFSAYTIQPTAQSPYKITVAVQFQMDNLRAREMIPRLENKSDDWGNSLKIGAHLDFYQRLFLGAVYEFGSGFSGNAKISEEVIFSDPNGLSSIGEEFSAELPDEFTVALSAQIQHSLILNLNLKKVYWKSLMFYDENKYRYDGSFLFTPFHNWEFVSGIYAKKRSYLDDFVSKEAYAYYWFGGIRRVIGQISLGMTFADSHLAKADLFGQRLFRLQMTYRL